MAVRYFEDIEVGKTERFGAYTVDRRDVLEFAQRYDPQPFHLSDEAAAATHFGRLAASGWHSCAMTMAMLVAHMETIGHVGLGSPGIDELRWLRPVYPGDVLRCEEEILDKRLSKSRPGLGLFRTRLITYNQDDVAVLSMVSTGMVATRAESDSNSRRSRRIDQRRMSRRFCRPSWRRSDR